MTSEQTEQLSEAYQQATPEELLAAFVAGETAALSALEAQLGGDLFNFLNRFIGQPGAARLAYKRIWAQVAKAAVDFKPADRLNVWLYQIARDEALSAVQTENAAHAPAAPVDEKQQLADIFCTGLPPLEELTAEDLAARLTLAVSVLPPEMREVFLLREHGDLTLPELAQIIGVSVDELTALLEQAFTALQAGLEAAPALAALAKKL